MDEPTRDEVRRAILNPLTVTEVTRCRAAAQVLAGEPWAAALLGAALQTRMLAHLDRMRRLMGQHESMMR